MKFVLFSIAIFYVLSTLSNHSIQYTIMSYLSYMTTLLALLALIFLSVIQSKPMYSYLAFRLILIAPGQLSSELCVFRLRIRDVWRVFQPGDLDKE